MVDRVRCGEAVAVIECDRPEGVHRRRRAFVEVNRVRVRAIERRPVASSGKLAPRPGRLHLERRPSPRVRSHPAGQERCTILSNQHPLNARKPPAALRIPRPPCASQDRNEPGAVDRAVSISLAAKRTLQSCNSPPGLATTRDHIWRISFSIWCWLCLPLVLWLFADFSG